MALIQDTCKSRGSKVWSASKCSKNIGQRSTRISPRSHAIPPLPLKWGGFLANLAVTPPPTPSEVERSSTSSTSRPSARARDPIPEGSRRRPPEMRRPTSGLPASAPRRDRRSGGRGGRRGPVALGPCRNQAGQEFQRRGLRRVLPAVGKWRWRSASRGLEPARVSKINIILDTETLFRDPRARHLRPSQPWSTSPERCRGRDSPQSPQSPQRSVTAGAEAPRLA